jgi:uncharacterized protein (TIGR02145 family)
MKHLLLLVVLLFFTIINLYSQNSNIQIVSEPGISIFLNGEYQGKTTSEMGGLIIENMKAGDYTIKAVKDGFTPQEGKIKLKWGEVLKYYVNPSFVPSINITQSGNSESQWLSLKTGKLKIQSLPIEIRIEIKSLNINDLKRQDEWLASPIQEGKYNAVFTWNGKTINYDIEIKYNEETSLFVNMMKNEVENRGKGMTSNESGSFVDQRDFKSYKWIKIGSQTWMAENLNFSTDDGSWCIDQKYGRHYNWKTANIACPAGWHLPSLAEFNILMKQVGSSHYEVEDELLPEGHSGFNALRGGFRDFNAKFYNVEKGAYFWCSDPSTSIIIYGGAGEQERMKASGLSVRCLKN